MCEIKRNGIFALYINSPMMSDLKSKFQQTV